MPNLKTWNVEDEQFWESTGKRVANRNLWISIPSLLCGFAVWGYWGIITVQMLNLGFPFTQSELFTLAAIAGLTGATLRIPSTFFIRIAGGRNTIFFTTALLIIPAIGAGICLQTKDTPLWQFQILALLSGFGGGNFASSMSNISFFYPKKMQGLLARHQCRARQFRRDHHADRRAAGHDVRLVRRLWRRSDGAADRRPAR